MSKFAEMTLETKPKKVFNGNGSKAWDTSGHLLVDLFYSMGAKRQVRNPKRYTSNPDISDQIQAIKAVAAIDVKTAIALLLYGRDLRGGMGEREITRQLMQAIHWDVALLNVTQLQDLFDKVVEVGRYDDLAFMFKDSVRAKALEFWAKKIIEQDGLACKWAPRKGPLAKDLTEALCALVQGRKLINPHTKERDYRRLIVAGSNTVEQLMSSKKWGEVDYNKVPSLATIRNDKAFDRHDFARHAEWKAGLLTGESKVNAGAVFPYQILYGSLDSTTAQAQWDAQPDWMEGNDGNTLVMVDVSGSMQTPIPGSPIQCLQVAVSLGIYIAERNRGEFKNELISFTDRPTMFKLSDEYSAREKAYILNQHVGYNTNIEVAYWELLKFAKDRGLAQADMPKRIVILSDMNFDNPSIRGKNGTVLKDMQKSFSNAGYTMPVIVFWNLNDSGTKPAKFNADGVKLVSGFSPALMKAVLNDQAHDPLQTVLDAIMVDRYLVV